MANALADVALWHVVAQQWRSIGSIRRIRWRPGSAHDPTGTLELQVCSHPDLRPVDLEWLYALHHGCEEIIVRTGLVGAPAQYELFMQEIVVNQEADHLMSIDLQLSGRRDRVLTPREVQETDVGLAQDRARQPPKPTTASPRVVDVSPSGVVLEAVKPAAGRRYIKLDD
jgi:hypothetical protein